MPMPRPTLFRSMGTPIGELFITADAVGLTGVHFGRPPVERFSGWLRDDALSGAASVTLGAAAEQLRQYFGGELTTFQLPLSAIGTAFQQRVWQALLTIQFGQSISYGGLARRIGAPQLRPGCRQRNRERVRVSSYPLSCHATERRDIGATGALPGFGGGIERQRWLLRP